MLRKIKPASILDVGTGWGTYGMICRSYFEDIECLDGIEIWKQNIKPWHKHIYDNIYHGDILHYELSKEYEVYLFVDVLEHIKKKDALALLHRLPGIKIISVPIGHLPQPIIDNPWEAHISEWEPSDIEKFKIEQYIHDKNHILAAIK